MPKLPHITGLELIRALERAEYTIARQRVSHVQPRRQDISGAVTTFPVPVHAGKTLKPGTLKGILRIAGLEVEDLLKLP